MYMTVLKADFDSLRSQEFPVNVNDANFMHKWITSQFDSTRTEEQILTFTDICKDAVYLYIQSKREFPEKNISRAGFKKLISFPVQAPKTPYITFKIFTTPVRRQDDKMRYLTTPEERSTWLVEKLDSCLTDIQVKEVNQRNVVVRKKTTNANGFTFTGTEFVGRAKITDKEAFMKLITKGIGREKVYGSGLLLFKELN